MLYLKEYMKVAKELETELKDTTIPDSDVIQHEKDLEMLVVLSTMYLDRIKRAKFDNTIVRTR